MAAKGNAGKGRKKGVPNKLTTQIKEAITTAATLYGEDGKGKEGMIGYMKLLAGSQPVAFAGLLGKVLPLQVTGEGGGDIRTVTRIELVARAADDNATD